MSSDGIMKDKKGAIAMTQIVRFQKLDHRAVQPHYGSADAAGAGHHSHTTHAHDQLQQTDACGTDPAGQINLKGSGHKPQKQVYTG